MDPISQVDRGLFGMESNHRVPLIRMHPKKTIVICNQGFIYNVRVPRDELHVKKICLSHAEHDRILAKAKGPSILDKELEVLRKAAIKKKEDIKAAEGRKRQIIENDLFAIKHEEESELQSRRLAYDRYQHMREKALIEKDNQIKKLDRWILNSKIQTERDKQLVWKKRCEAIEISREKGEFDRVLKCTQEAIRKDEEKEKKRLRDAYAHLESIKEQVKEREQAALNKRKERLYEVSKVRETIQEKNRWLDEFKEERLKELKACGIPEKYCRYVRRKTKEDEANPNQYHYRAHDTLDQLPRWTNRSNKKHKEQEDPLNPFPALPPISMKDVAEGVEGN
ncbi:cilia- and flagella-associated protein 45-like [Phyllopteryx taeniolatus]|uniref:cilia- and flagella-associated protein 45-like n=1 Tax=Phyllopteryx taeniolatus TaxID=161469 RepID=UPI002AD51BDB|nr:cilia- and flagella-associated protein 45-like [Phyllopteryx taeniolatus]